MKQVIEIGGTPNEEECASIGPNFDRGAELNRLECEAYIAALRKVHGDPPPGCKLFIKANPHEFGTYREVAVQYDPTDAAQAAYANLVENGLSTWGEADMWPPVRYRSPSDPSYVLKDSRLWSRKDNPRLCITVEELAKPL